MPTWNKAGRMDPVLNATDVVMIGAMSEDGVIGSGDGMPWHVPEEYRHFVDTVQGQCVIIGRKSYEIFGADFQADTWVISRSSHLPSVHTTPQLHSHRLEVVGSLAAALNAARQRERTTFIAGGRSIYAASLAFANRMLLSTIKGTYTGDTFFPQFSQAEWNLVEREDRGRYVLHDWHRRGEVGR